MIHICEYDSSDEEASSPQTSKNADRTSNLTVSNLQDGGKMGKIVSNTHSITTDYISGYSRHKSNNVKREISSNSTDELLLNQISSSTASKYFSLEESDSSDSDTATHEQSTQDVPIVCDSKYGDLPQSHFWRGGNSPAPLKVARTSLTCTVEQSNECGSVDKDKLYSPQNSRDLNKQGNSNIWNPRYQKREIEIQPLTTVNTTKKMKLKEMKKHSTELHSQDRSNDKLYFVHHKTAPHLNSKTECRIPRERLNLLQGHTGGINRIKWCIEQYSHLLLSSSMDRTVKIWNAFSNGSRCVRTLTGHAKAVKEAVWHTSGRQVISCGYDRCAKLWDVEKGTELNTYEHPDFVLTLKYHPVDSNQFVSGSNSVLYCWDTRSGTSPVRKYTYTGDFGQVQDLEFMPDGSQFLTCGDLVSKDSCDKNIMSWDFKTGVVLSNQIYQERYTCTRLRVHPAGSHFIAQTQGNYAALFSTSRPYKLDKSKRFEGHKVEGYPIGCDFSKDGSFLVSGSSSGDIYYYNYTTSKLLKVLHMGTDACIDVACHPVLFSTVAVAMYGGVINVWQ